MRTIEEVTFIARPHKIFGASRLSMSRTDCTFEVKGEMVLVRSTRGDSNVYEIPRGAVMVRFKDEPEAVEPKKSK